MLTSDRVEEIFKDCLFKDEEIVDGKPTSEPKIVNGITHNFGFHAARLESHKAELKEMLSHFEKPFYKGTGDGYTFLNLCMTADGEQWTGMHERMEQLICLGMGVGFVEFCAPRDMWQILPGGMPYIVIDLN